MKKDDLINFIKTYETEYSNLVVSCKEYYTKTEEKLIEAKNSEAELIALKSYVSTSQNQLQILNEINDKNVSVNNDLQNKLQDLIYESKDDKQTIEKLK